MAPRPRTDSPAEIVVPQRTPRRRSSANSSGRPAPGEVDTRGGIPSRRGCPAFRWACAAQHGGPADRAGASRCHDHRAAAERNLRRSESAAEQLQGALNCRVIIEQAKGKLAERTGLNKDRAFGLLREYAATATSDSPTSPATSLTGHRRLPRPTWQGSARCCSCGAITQDSAGPGQGRRRFVNGMPDSPCRCSRRRAFRRACTPRWLAMRSAISPTGTPSSPTPWRTDRSAPAPRRGGRAGRRPGGAPQASVANRPQGSRRRLSVSAMSASTPRGRAGPRRGPPEPAAAPRRARRARPVTGPPSHRLPVLRPGGRAGVPASMATPMDLGGCEEDGRGKRADRRACRVGDLVRLGGVALGGDPG